MWLGEGLLFLRDVSIVLQEVYDVAVAEDVAVGTAVQRVIASDADEPSTRNSRIEYLLESSDSSDMFSIHRRTGNYIL